MIQFSSVAESCLALCYPIDCSTPGFPVHHQLPELAQTHVYWVGDAIQPSNPLIYWWLVFIKRFNTSNAIFLLYNVFQLIFYVVALNSIDCSDWRTEEQRMNFSSALTFLLWTMGSLTFISRVAPMTLYNKYFYDCVSSYVRLWRT